ncbi:transposase [Salinispora tropica]|uniref:transposase n=1 Tax=Salinispora tropica TaxID=168695 RepID=UPI001930BD5A
MRSSDWPTRLRRSSWPSRGVGADVAGGLLAATGDNPERLRSESAFAHLCGVAPIPASSGKTNRHRLNRAGNRHLYILALSGLATTNAPAPTPPGAPPRARPNGRSSAALSATSPEKSSQRCA